MKFSSRRSYLAAIYWAIVICCIGITESNKGGILESKSRSGGKRRSYTVNEASLFAEIPCCLSMICTPASEKSLTFFNFSMMSNSEVLFGSILENVSYV